MNLKTIIIIILGSFLIGAGIFLLELGLKNQKSSLKPQNPILKPFFNSQSLIPSPSPTIPPINNQSNLKEEIEKLNPRDFSQDLKNLNKETENF